MRVRQVKASTQNLILVLVVGFVFDPGWIAWSTNQLVARQSRGARSPLGVLVSALRMGGDVYALGPNDMVETDVPDAFVDIASQGGTVLPLATESAAITVPLGFNFPYYGSSFAQVAVTTKGYVIVGSALVSGSPNPFPTATAPTGVIAPFWDDLDPSLNPSAKVAFLKRGQAPNRAFVAQWTDVPFANDPASRLTFEAVLFETGEVQFHYGDLRNGDGTTAGRASGAKASVGLENADGTIGTQVAFQQAGALAKGRSFAFTHGAGPLKRGDVRGDLNGDGVVNVLDQSRLVEIGSRQASYAPATARELLLADVAPRPGTGRDFGDGVVDVQDRDFFSQTIVGRTKLSPVLAIVTPEVAAPADTITLDGSGFGQPASANTVAFVTTGGVVSAAASSVDAGGTELTVQVPSGLVLSKVKVVTGGLASNGQRLIPAGVPTIQSLSPVIAAVGDEVQLRGLNLSATAQVSVGGVPAVVTLADIQPPDGRLVFKVPAGAPTGSTNVTVTVGTQASAPFAFTVADTPVAVITTPASSDEVLGPITVVGTASNPSPENFSSYVLTLTRQSVGGLPSVIGSGTTPVVNGALGRLDPTLLVNGFYSLNLTVTNKFGRQSTTEVDALQVRGDQKVGVFTLSFQDVTLTANGFDVVVNRTYDSREKRTQDFGVGWKLTLSNVDMEKDLGNNIFVTLPSGKRDVYQFNPTPTGDPTIFITHYDPSPGVFDVLGIPGIDNQQLFLNQGTFFTIAGEPFDPTDITITRVDGTVLAINKDRGLDSITDTNGNLATFSANGIQGVGVTLPFQRDSIGRITTITDPQGATISYLYNDAGDLTDVIDRVGNKTHITYDGNHNLKDIFSPSGIRAARSDYDSTGRLIATSDPDGNKTIFDHDLSGRTETITDRLGNKRQVQYDTNGDVVGQIDALGNKTTYEYRNRLQTAVVDALGNRWEKTYNSQGLALTDRDPLGNTTVRTYDGNGHVLTVTDANGNTTVNTYDPNGNLDTTTDALGNPTHFSYLKGNLAHRTDALGNTTSFEYDARGDVSFVTDALGNQTIYNYNSLGDQTNVAQGIRLSEYAFVPFRATASQYDATGRITTAVNTLGHASGIEYDQDGHQHATIDALGQRTTFHFDGRGNQNSTLFPDGTSVSASFDAEQRRTTSTDQIGRVTSYVYDPVGRVTDTIFPDGTRTHTEFDAVGRVTTQTNARGFKTSVLYDAAGRRTHVIDALGHVTVSAYDSVGNVISVTDARGNCTQYHYDALNRRDKTIFPDGTFTRVVYDQLGRKFQEFDQANKKTEYHYDELSRQTQVVTATGAITSFVYDNLSNLVERHDPLNRVTKFDHDALGRVTQTTRPLGMSQFVAYDAIGRVKSSTDFNGQMTVFTYDDASRLKQKALADGRTVDFAYTPTGQRYTITDSVRGVTTFHYDSRDRLLDRDEPEGYVVSYTYDEAGNRLTVTEPAGTTVYTFDPLDRMDTVTSAAGGASKYAYDEVGNRKTLTYPNGVVATYAYDNLNRLTNLSNTLGTAVISSFTYALGPAGNRLSVIEQSGRVVGYGYDDDYRLTSESIFDPGATNPTTFGYVYDAAGNRKTKTTTHPDFTTEQIAYSYDDNDRLLSETLTSGMTTSSTSYSYDNNGSTLLVTAPTQTKQFLWTPERRLASCTITGAGAATVFFRYDEDGIRVRKIKDGVGTQFVIDQMQPFQQVVEERDTGSGALNVSYTYGDDLISQDRAGTRRFYSTDGQLSTRQLTDDTGNVTDSYAYDASGVTLTSSGSTVNAYKYTGEQEDSDAGGYYLRARYYNSANGRFLCADFAGRDGPSYHKYIYALNNPANARDPSGLFTLVEVLWTTAIVGLLATLAAGIGIGAIDFAHEFKQSQNLRSAAIEFMLGFATTVRNGLFFLLAVLAVVWLAGTAAALAAGGGAAGAAAGGAAAAKMLAFIGGIGLFATGFSAGWAAGEGNGWDFGKALVGLVAGFMVGLGLKATVSGTPSVDMANSVAGGKAPTANTQQFLANIKLKSVQGFPLSAADPDSAIGAWAEHGPISIDRAPIVAKLLNLQEGEEGWIFSCLSDEVLISSIARGAGPGRTIRGFTGIVRLRADGSWVHFLKYDPATRVPVIESGVEFGAPNVVVEGQ